MACYVNFSTFALGFVGCSFFQLSKSSGARYLKSISDQAYTLKADRPNRHLILQNVSSLIQSRNT